MSDSSAIRAGRAFISIEADDSKLRADLDKTMAKFKAWGAAMTAIGASIFAGGGFIAGSMMGFSKMFATTGSDALLLSQKMGVSTEAATRFAHAAQEVNVETDAMATSVNKMNKFLTTAAEGNREAYLTLANLHVTLKQLNQLNPVQRFGALSDAINKIVDPSIRAGLASQVFGRGVSEILPLIAQGRAGMNKWAQDSDRLGTTIGGANAIAAYKLKIAYDDLWDSIRMVGFGLGMSIAPRLERVTSLLTGAAIAAQRLVGKHTALANVLFFGSEAATVGGSALLGIGQVAMRVTPAVDLLGKTFAALGTVSTIGVGLLGTALSVVLSPTVLLSAAIVGLGGYFLYTSGAAARGAQVIKSAWGSAMTYIGVATRPLTQYLRTIWNTVKSDALDAFAGITDAMAGGDWSLAARILWTGLQLEFTRGKLAVVEIFNSIKGPILSAFDGVMAGLETLWADFESYLLTSWPNATAFIRETWAKAIFGMKGAFALLASGVKFLWNDLQGWLTDKFLRIQGLTPAQLADARKINADATAAANKDIASQMAGDIADAEKEKYAAINAAKADQGKSPQQIAAEHAARLQEIQKQYAQARAAGDNSEVKKLQDEIDSLQKQLKADRAAAAGVRSAAGIGAPPLPPSVGDLSAIMANAKSTGTFNPSAIWGLTGGSDPFARRTAIATEAMRQLLQDLSKRPAGAGWVPRTVTY